MKNQKEIYIALLTGETLSSDDRSDACMDLSTGMVISKSTGEQCFYGFDEPEDWQIYKEPAKWYENIPEDGVLCWVKDGDREAFNKYPEMVTNYCDDPTHFFETPNESWMYATPLTKQEIQMFMDNAPEINDD